MIAIAPLFLSVFQAPFAPVILGEAEDATSLKEAVEGIFPRLSPQDLDSAIRHVNSTVALHAAWERARRAQYATSAMGRFVGVLESRLGVTPPQQWVRIIHTTKGRQAFKVRAVRDKLYPGRLKLPDQVGQGESHLAIGVRGSTSSRNLRLLIRSHALRIPIRDFGHTAITAASDRASACVALHSWKLACAATLHYFQGSRRVWKADIWGGGPQSGDGAHVLQLVQANNRIYVFGVSEDCIYVEAFDARDGTPHTRFAIGEED